MLKSAKSSGPPVWTRRVHISQSTMECLHGEFDVEPGNGGDRCDYLRERGIDTYLVVVPRGPAGKNSGVNGVVSHPSKGLKVTQEMTSLASDDSRQTRTIHTSEMFSLPQLFCLCVDVWCCCSIAFRIFRFFFSFNISEAVCHFFQWKLATADQHHGVQRQREHGLHHAGGTGRTGRQGNARVHSCQGKRKHGVCFCVSRVSR